MTASMNKITTDQISKILKQVNPAAIPADFPDDEYDTEAGDILTRIQALEHVDIAKVQVIVYDVLDRWFSPLECGGQEDIARQVFHLVR